MKEDKEDSQRTDILDQEQVEVEELAWQLAPVGKLVTHHLMRHKPAQEDTRQEAHDSQEYLACDEVMTTSR